MGFDTLLEVDGRRVAVELIEYAMSVGATDIIFNPGSEYGHILIRANQDSVYNKELPVERVIDLARQCLDEARLEFDIPLLETKVGSLELPYGRVRLNYTRTESGPLLRLRLQVRGLLSAAKGRFLRGEFGGVGILPFINFARGIILVSGLASSGKTSCLSHLAGTLPKKPVVVSEVDEFVVDCVRVDPQECSGPEGLLEAVQAWSDVPLFMDEMDEGTKLTLASQEAEHRLVVATIGAPNVAMALRKYAGRCLPAKLLVGIMRVRWAGGKGTRNPDYLWIPVGDRVEGRCPFCSHKVPSGEKGLCVSCGVPLDIRFMERDVLGKMNTLEGFRYLDNLEKEWER